MPTPPLVNTQPAARRRPQGFQTGATDAAARGTGFQPVRATPVLRATSLLVKATLLTALALFSVGCNSWPKDINVALDKSLTQDAGATPSVDVHLIGIRRGELRRYRTMPVTEYWSPSGPSRQALPARKEVFLGPGATSRTVSGSDPVWNQWDAKVRPYLVVLADLRGVTPRGDEDPRRVVLPLDKKRWGAKQIKLLVHRDRVEVLTPPKPKG